MVGGLKKEEVKERIQYWMCCLQTLHPTDYLFCSEIESIVIVVPKSHIAMLY